MLLDTLHCIVYVSNLDRSQSVFYFVPHSQAGSTSPTLIFHALHIFSWYHRPQDVARCYIWCSGRSYNWHCREEKFPGDQKGAKFRQLFCSKRRILQIYLALRINEPTRVIVSCPMVLLFTKRWKLATSSIFWHCFSGSCDQKILNLCFSMPVWKLPKNHQNQLWSVMFSKACLKVVTQKSPIGSQRRTESCSSYRPSAIFAIGSLIDGWMFDGWGQTEAVIWPLPHIHQRAM